MFERLKAKVLRILWRNRASFCATISYIEIVNARRLYRGRIRIISLTEHMGDVVACLPVAADLRRRYSEDHIVWVVNKAYAPLLKNNPNIDALITHICLGQWIILKRFLGAGGASAVIDLHLHGKPCAKTGLVLSKKGALQRIDVRNYYDFGCLLEAFSLSAGIPYPENPQPDLSYLGSTTTPQKRYKLLRPYVVLHTQSNENERNWTAAKFSELTDFLVNKGISVVEIGHASIINCTASSFYRYCGYADIASYVAVIGSSLLFVGIDSGFAHVANAMKVKGVIILGTYRTFEDYHPYSGFYADIGNCVVVRAVNGPARDVSLQAVCEAVLKFAMSASVLSNQSG